MLAVKYFQAEVTHLLSSSLLHPYSRFVEDVPLASTMTSNYYNAISMALKLLTNMKNNRNTHVSNAELDLFSPGTFEHLPFQN